MKIDLVYGLDYINECHALFMCKVIITIFDVYRSLHLLVFWILFENVMSLHRTKATIIGLLNLHSVNEWIVTDKLGDTSRRRSAKSKADSLSWKFGEG